MIQVSDSTAQAIQLIAELNKIEDKIIRLRSVTDTVWEEDAQYKEVEQYFAPAREFILSTITNRIIDACYSDTVEVI